MYTPSFWEKDSIFSNIDVCIVGSGIVGLCAAVHLKTVAPALNIIVVDRGFIPFGASTRNAGFACFGSMTELIDDMTRESEEEVFQRVGMRWKGLQKLRSLLGDKNIHYQEFGGYEVFTAADNASFEECKDKMNDFNRKMKPVTGHSETYIQVDNRIAEFGFQHVNHLILNQCEGQIDTGKMMESLLKLAYDAGVKIINGLSISEIKNETSQVELSCGNDFSFFAKRVLVANNGFAANLLQNINVLPARAQVLITKPIEGLKVKGCFHYEKGYYYFRNVGNRILFGGGRNLDIKGEETTEFGLTELIQNRLDELLREVILPHQKYEVDMRWSGIMGVGNSKSTIVKKIDENIYCAVRMGGMGVAIGSIIGEQGADMVLKSL